MLPRSWQPRRQQRFEPHRRWAAGRDPNPPQRPHERGTVLQPERHRQRRGLHRRRQGRAGARSGLARQRGRRRGGGRRSGSAQRSVRARLHGLRIRRAQSDGLRGRRRDEPLERLRSNEAGRRDRGPNAVPQDVGPARELGVQRARRPFRQDDVADGSHAR